MSDGAIIYEAVIIALIVLFGLSPLLSRFYKEHHWIPERGTVVENTVYDSKGKYGTTSYWVPKVEFSARGTSHTFLLGITGQADGPPKYRVGDRVDILFKPSNPSRAIFNVWRPYLINFAITGSIALVLLVPYALVRLVQ